MAKLCFVVDVVAGPVDGGGVPPPATELEAEVLVELETTEFELDVVTLEEPELVLLAELLLE
jgi:hypothetical protein